LFEHDLFRKPVAAFRDYALAPLGPRRREQVRAAGLGVGTAPALRRSCAPGCLSAADGGAHLVRPGAAHVLSLRAFRGGALSERRPRQDDDRENDEKSRSGMLRHGTPTRLQGGEPRGARNVPAGGEAPRPLRQAWPASIDSIAGSTPIRRNAISYLWSKAEWKMSSGSAGQFSQPFAWTSLSS